MENEGNMSDAQIFEDLKKKAQKEIDYYKRQRQTLLGNLKIAGSDVPPANTNIHHLEMIKEKLNRPENQELLKDEDKNYLGRLIDIPNKRREIYNNLSLKITKPINVYVYYSTYKINFKENGPIDQYFKPKTTTTYDYFDDAYVLGKFYINLENPKYSVFKDKFSYKTFEKTHNILIIKNYKGNPEQLLELRDIYMTDLLERGLDYAINEITNYAGFAISDNNRSRE